MLIQKTSNFKASNGIEDVIVQDALKVIGH